MLRNPNSIPKDDTIIEDPVLEPFFITRSSIGSLAVYERVVAGPKKNRYIKNISYPSSFRYALKVIATEKLNRYSDTKKFGLKEYIDRWDEISKEITSSIKGDL